MIPTLYPCFRHWSNVGTVWIYSDPHFGDKDLAAGIQRPSDEEHVKRINACVGRKDTLILLGDVGDLTYAKQLRGYKVLICGNHDAGGTTYEEIFDEVYTGPLFIAEKLLLSHEPVDLPFAFNIHGHDHVKQDHDGRHYNVCSDVTNYTPLNFNKFIKNGGLSKIPSIHRVTIDSATKRARKRNKKF